MPQVTKEQLRAKLLRVIPRYWLENIAKFKNPHHLNREGLEQTILETWDDDTLDGIIRYLEKAR